MSAVRICLILVKLLLIALTGSTQAHAQVLLNLTTGWNLLGNSSNLPLAVATTFSDSNQVVTVWKWNRTGSIWAFYAPSMSSADLATYAQGKGYEVLTSVDPKEGFWVNAKTDWTATVTAGTPVTLAASDLQEGWNLVGSADAMTPSELNQSLGCTLNAAGKVMVTAWSWDNSNGRWKFFAPALEAQGGTVLADYITNKGYLTFTSPLTAAEGFWLNIGPPTPTVPSAPTGVTATAGNAQATVTFTAPCISGGSAITGYAVTSTPAGGIDSNAGTTGLSHIITGLTNGTTYTFMVKATNSVGTGAASAASNSVTPATVPGAPTIGTATRGNAQVSVAFSAPASNGGAPITSYTVTSSPGGITATGTASPIIVTGLTNGTAYTFTVRAINSAGTGAASATSTSVTPATTPGAPTIGAATRGNAQVSVAFTSPASNGGAAITSYTVTSSPGGITKTGTASPITVTGLTNGTAYTFTVTATNSVGSGAASAASNSVTPATVPGAPTIGTAMRGDAQVSVSFSAPASNGGDAITSYTATSSPGGITATGAASPIIVTGLTNGTAYTFTVKATNSVGTSAASTASNSATPATTPGAPTIGIATGGDAQATVTFSAPSSNGGAAITGYTVTSSPGGMTAAGTASPIIVTGLANLTPYIFTVTAINSVGTGTASAASRSVTPIAPSVPVACSAPTGPPALSMVASRNSGVAPLAVFFDATGTTSAAVTSRPFHDLEYRWNFGDPGSGAWGDKSTGAAGTGANTSRNLAMGPVAAHVFETPGNYTVQMDAFDGANTASCSVQITVHDPGVVAAGDSTICVAATSLPVAGSGGCPSGAAVAQQSDWPTIINTYALSGRRVLLKGGDIFTGAATATLTSSGPGIIGSYGGTNAILRNTGAGTFSPTLRVSTAKDWRLMDLEFDGELNGSRSAIFGIGNFSQLTMLRLNIHDIGGAIEIPLQSATPPLHDQLFLVDSTMQRLLSSGGPSGGTTHGILSGASRTAIMGNLFNDSNTASAEHMIRIQFMDRGVINNNRIQNVHVGREMLALRAPCSAACPTGSGEYFPALIDSAAAATRKVVISDNRIDINTFTGVKIGQVNNNDSTLIHDVILERNYYAVVAGGGGGIMSWASDLTVRNEIIDVSPAFNLVGISIERATAGMAAPNNVRIYNNSIFSTDTSSSFRGVFLRLGTTNAVIKNNLGYAPNDTAPTMIFDEGSVEPILANNSSNNNVRNTAPAWVSLTPTTPTQYQLTAPSYIAGDATVPVFSDFFRRNRPNTGAVDIGATEF